MVIACNYINISLMIQECVLMVGHEENDPLKEYYRDKDERESNRLRELGSRVASLQSVDSFSDGISIDSSPTSESFGTEATMEGINRDLNTIMGQLGGVSSTVQSHSDWINAREAGKLTRRVINTWAPITIPTRALVPLPDAIRAEGLIANFGSNVDNKTSIPSLGKSLGVDMPLPPLLIEPFLPSFPSEVGKTLFPSFLTMPEIQNLISQFTAGLISREEFDVEIQGFMRELPPEVVIESELARRNFMLSVPLTEIRANFTTLIQHSNSISGAVESLDARARWLRSQVQTVADDLSGLSVKVGQGLTSTDVKSIVTQEITALNIKNPPWSVSDITGLKAELDAFPTFGEVDTKIKSAIDDLPSIPTATELAALVTPTTLGIPTFPVAFSDVSSLLSGFPSIPSQSDLEAFINGKLPSRSTIESWMRLDLPELGQYGNFTTCFTSKIDAVVIATIADATVIEADVKSAMDVIRAVPQTLKNCIMDKSTTTGGIEATRTISIGTMADCIAKPFATGFEFMKTKLNSASTRQKNSLVRIANLLNDLKLCLNGQVI